MYKLSDKKVGVPMARTAMVVLQSAKRLVKRKILQYQPQVNKTNP